MEVYNYAAIVIPEVTKSSIDDRISIIFNEGTYHEPQLPPQLTLPRSNLLHPSSCHRFI